MTIGRGSSALAWAAAGAMTCAATADYTQAIAVGYTVTAADFGGAEVTVYVVDLYLKSNDSADTLLNVYNWNTVGGAASYFQSFTGTGWQPTNLGGPFDTTALQQADSFVTIGGFGADVLQVPGAGAGSGLDPNFGGNNAAAPGVDAGWYNGNPQSLNGAVITYDNGIQSTFIGRFSSLEGAFSLDGTLFEATWNQGLGTPGQQQQFMVLEGGSDCNDNGVFDVFDIDSGYSTDCNGNIIPDECELAEGLVADVNENDVPDICEALRIPDDFPTIADAVSMAPEGSIIYVPPGTYETPLNLDRAVFVVAYAGAGSTRLDGSKSLGPVVIADGAPAGAVLAGFTIRAGDPSADHPMGGGIVGVDSAITIANCVIVGNTGMEGGGLRFEGGSPTLIDCTVHHNLSYGAGGGVHADGGDLTVEGSVFESNVSLTDVGHAIAISGCFTISDCDVVNHPGPGAAISTTSLGLAETQVPCTAASNCRVTDNNGSALSGIRDVAECTIVRNGGDGISSGQFVTNTMIRENDGVGIGASTFAWSIEGSTICGNLGGAIAETDPVELIGLGNIVFDDRCPALVVPDDAETIQSAIIIATDGDRIAVRDRDEPHAGFSFGGRDVEVIGVPGDDLVEITGPVLATGGEPATTLLRGFELRDGDGIDDLDGHEGTVVGGNLILDGSAMTIDQCRIQFGLAELGGGVFVHGGDASIRDCYLTGNRAMREGGGIYVDGSVPTALSLSGLNVSGNFLEIEPHTRGGGVRVAGDQATVTISGVTICSNDRENLAGPVTESGTNTICLAFDCDDNGVEDASDIVDNGRPDCNGNLVPDDCDIAGGTSLDCNANGVPDECDIAGGKADCDDNGIIDVCETGDGDAPDCNANGIPDVCDLAGGASDLDLDGVPDECQPQLVFNVPDRFGSIGDAINAATNGSRIALAPGNYNEAVNLGSKNLEIVGDPADPASVELDGFELGSTVLTIAGGQDASTRIAGVTIKQGIADTPEPGSPANLVGGGLYIDGASPIVEDCIITTNDAARGGGAYIRNSSATIRRTIIEANGSASGAGIWWSGGQITIEDCMIRDNTAEGNGGGLRLATDGGSILGGSITENLAADDGAGVWWQGSISPLAFDGVAITGNIAGGEGGGVLAKFAAPGVTFANSTVCDNAPDEIAGPYQSLGGNDLCVCPWDLSGNGVVGAEDVGILLSQWGACPDGCSADFDGDGVAGAADLGAILGAWGVCP